MTALSFFDVAPGREAFPSLLSGTDWRLLLMFQAMSLAGGLGMYFGIGGALELLYYRRGKRGAEAWKCQPKRWTTPSMRRKEMALGAANLTVASSASGLIAYHVATGGASSVYFDVSRYGLPYALLSTLAYFLITDGALYWAHRLFHRPALFRHIHRWHHRWTSPTAFTSAAMHPVEFMTYQSIMALPLFFFIPLHVAGVVGVLLYQNYVALIDHSGVNLHSWLPWQPPTRFHDDHHVYFHVNYGQNLGIWDRVFGTFRRHGRKYGVDVFGGRGAPVDGAPTAAPFIDYGRRATRASVGTERAPNASEG